ncbi:MAG: type II toxin-antitoxin system prevent-host-death family antitoxin [Novosphingobium sp.]
MSATPSSVRDIQVPFKHAEAASPVVAGAPHQVPIKEAKARLTELLRKVEAGERIVLTRHGKPIADLVPHVEEPPRLSLLERVEAWHRDNPSPGLGWIAPDFDDPLPEDFLLRPLPDDFDEKLADHDRRIDAAWRAMDAQADEEA